MFAIKKGITLIELIISLSILGIGLVAILRMLNVGVTYVDRTRQEVIAINLAREGVEGVYQIRNTNRMRRGGKKDECRLKTNPLSGNETSCQDDPRMQSGNYLLEIKETANNQKYYVLSGVGNPDLDISQYDNDDTSYAMCYGSGNWYHCPGETGNALSEGRFFRQIDGLGLFRKDINQTGGVYLGGCTHGAVAGCGDEVAKEFRFCSIVQYTKKIDGEVKLCGVLTNFLE